MLSSVTGVVNIALTSKLWRLDPLSAMTFIKNWEDFERSAEKLYLANPMKVRYTMKYRHSQGALILKFTDDAVCLQYKTEVTQDLRKIDRFMTNLTRHMVSNDK